MTTKFFKDQPVKFKSNPGYTAQVGARATVVEPAWTSPYRHDRTVYLQVKWDRSDYRSGDQNDGGYLHGMFEPIITPTSELNIGDRVMIVDCEYADRVAGATGVVAKFNHGRMPYVRLDNSEPYSGWNIDSATRAVRLSREAPMVSPTITYTAPATTIGATPTLSDDLNLKPQARKILSHMKRGNTISPLEAQNVFGVYRLAASIHDIRSAGYRVRTLHKRDEVGHKYARYELVVH